MQQSWWSMFFWPAVAAIGIISTAVVAGFAASWAKGIGNKQNEINEGIKKLSEKQVEADHFIEISVQARSVPDSRTRNYAFLENWELVVKSIGTYPAYINRYLFNKTSSSIRIPGCAAIPSDGYVIPIEKLNLKHIASNTNSFFELTIDFQDYSGNKYESIHIATLTKERLEIQSKVKEPIKNE